MFEAGVINTVLNVDLGCARSLVYDKLILITKRQH